MNALASRPGEVISTIVISGRRTQQRAAALLRAVRQAGCRKLSEREIRELVAGEAIRPRLGAPRPTSSAPAKSSTAA
jgi:hypothetical protein